MAEFGDFVPGVHCAVSGTTLAIACSMAWLIADALLGLYKVITGTFTRA